jgi:hypothetical protein
MYIEKIEWQVFWNGGSTYEWGRNECKDEDMKKGWKRSCRNEFFLSGRRGTTWKKLCTLDSFLILLEIYNNTPKFKFIQIQIIQSRVSSPNDKFLPRTGPAKHTKEVRHARYDEAQPIIYFKKKRQRAGHDSKVSSRPSNGPELVPPAAVTPHHHPPFRPWVFRCFHKLQMGKTARDVVTE